MDLKFSEEQELLAESAANMATSLSSLNAERNLHGWKQIAESGFLEMRSWQEGRPLASVVDVGVVSEAFGRKLVPESFLGATLAIDLLGRCGFVGAPSDVSVALQSDLIGLMEVGEKGFIWDGHHAQRGVVIARREQDRFVIELAMWPDRPDQCENICADETRFIVGFETSPDREAVGHLSSDNFAIWQAVGLALISLEMVGVAAEALDVALEYAALRSQFDRSISSFQAVQHLCAEQFVSLNAARSCAYYAAWAVDNLETGAALQAARVAKTFAGQTAVDVAEAAIQVHGGVGMTWDCNAHRFLRRILVNRQTFGNEDYQLRMISEKRFRGTE